MIGNEYGKNLDCPICDGGIPNDQRKGEYVGALSRFDNKTEVCSACGTMEALVDWVSREEWQRVSVREDWAHWKVTVLRMERPQSWSGSHGGYGWSAWPRRGCSMTLPYELKSGDEVPPIQHNWRFIGIDTNSQYVVIHWKCDKCGKTCERTVRERAIRPTLVVQRPLEEGD